MAADLLLDSQVSGDSVESGLLLWENVQNLGKKERTVQFHEQIIETIRKHLPDRHRAADSLTEQDLLVFAQRVNHFCPSRWNTMVAALRSVTGKAHILKRRKARFREFNPPTQHEFSKLLVECDALHPKSKAGQVVRFFSLSGVRFCEAKRLRLENIGEDRVNISASISKNGRPRSIPFLPGMASVVSDLRGTRAGGELLIPKPHVRRALKKACKRAGIPELSYHSLRHLFATRCIESGVDIPTVARWLGHVDGGSLLARMYFHLLSGHSVSMAAKVVF